MAALREVHRKVRRRLHKSDLIGHYLSITKVQTSHKDGTKEMAQKTKCVNYRYTRAWVAELAYAPVSKTGARKGMGVRFPPQAPSLKDLHALAISVVP